MAEANFSARQKALLARAHKVVAAAAEDYPARLQDQLRDLQRILNGGAPQDAILLAHKLEGEAALLGWPLVTELAGLLRRHLERQGRFTEASRAALHCLGLMIKERMSGRPPEARLLLQKLRAAIAREQAGAGQEG